jgi:4-amino-4-deoxy-L-arabinose transferase-like glycosyltransferase
VYAARFGGVAGGLICLAVYVTAPLFLVFGPLVLTDIPIALFSVLTVWAFANLWQKPESRQIRIFALCFAGALLVKFSAIILMIGFLVAGLSTRWMPVQGQPSLPGRWSAVRRGVLLAVLLAYCFYFVLSWNAWAVQCLRSC